MIFNNKEIKGAIFDMDGTLIDSTGIWREIDEQFFARRNMVCPSDYAQQIVHLGLKQAATFTKKRYHIQDDEKTIVNEWQQSSMEMYHHKVLLKSQALELLQFFYSHGIKMAIATANDEKLYQPCLKRLGIEQYFDYIADVNQVKEGKHSAKIYTYLADKMAVKPENVIVLEDMPTCIKTAHEAGFITIAVADPASKDFEKQKREDSDLFIENFQQLIDLLKLQ